jgi:putative colanic acid biosynthesis acetyltransferase WcaF
MFDRRIGLDRGRGRLIEVLWYLLKMVFFLTAFPWPSRVKVAILRLFGATIGQGVVIKPRVSIVFPWKLSIGEDSWIGEEVLILNLDYVRLGMNTCISQRVFLCTGNHDYRVPSMPYRNAHIVLGDGVWIGAQSFVAPGVEVGVDSVVAAGSVVIDSLPANIVAGGVPAVVKGVRWKPVDDRKAHL